MSNINIERIMNNLPSNTWESSMCIGVCLPPDQDTTSAIIAAGDTLDFSFHFFTDILMIGPDTGRARIRFSNANGNQQPITQNYRGITYGHNTNIQDHTRNKKITSIYNIIGKQEKQKKDQIQIIIYDDGTLEKKIVVEN